MMTEELLCDVPVFDDILFLRARLWPIVKLPSTVEMSFFFYFKERQKLVGKCIKTRLAAVWLQKTTYRNRYYNFFFKFRVLAD